MKFNVIEKLNKLSDLNYKKFHAKILHTVPEVKIIGVRIPDIKKLAKEFSISDALEFLHSEHYYYEEFLLHGILLGLIKFTENELFLELENFIPQIDNWAVCDTTVSGLKHIKRNKEKFFKYCKIWLNSPNEYTVRFAIVSLLVYFLDDDFDESILYELAKKESSFYYVNMALAWFFSFALIKQYDLTVKLFENNKITNQWVHNKALQKALESYRIPLSRKEYLKSLKITFKHKNNN